MDLCLHADKTLSLELMSADSWLNLSITCSFRGGTIIKKRENFGVFRKYGGGGVRKKMSKIQIRTFENPWGGGLNYSFSM